MLYVMLASLTLTFTMLGLAKRLPDPYWPILLQAQEVTLAVFLFAALAIVFRSFNLPQHITFRGKPLVDSSKRMPWTLLLSLLLSSSAVTYRFATLKAFIAWHETSLDNFDPWVHPGNLFAITFAAIAATLAFAHLGDKAPRSRLFALAVVLASLASYSPLLMRWQIAPYHPAALLLVAAAALVLFAVSRIIQKRWGIL